MKTLLLLKQFDLLLQLAACILPLVFAVIVADLSAVLLAYLMVGIAQIISCLLNGALLSYYQKHLHRKMYQYILTSVGLLAGASALIGNGQIGQVVFYGIMVVSPFIAVWYFWFSYKETKFARSLANRNQFVNI